MSKTETFEIGHEKVTGTVIATTGGETRNTLAPQHSPSTFFLGALENGARAFARDLGARAPKTNPRVSREGDNIVIDATLKEELWDEWTGLLRSSIERAFAPPFESAAAGGGGNTGMGYRGGAGGEEPEGVGTS